MKQNKFYTSDEGLPCVNTVEKLYLGLLVTVFALGLFSILRLSYFKNELRRVFDSRPEFIHYSVHRTLVFQVQRVEVKVKEHCLRY